MYTFDSLVDEILKNKPDLDRTKLDSIVKDKMSNVGGGFLTKQGALFLIAGELGIKLKRADSADLTLKDLYIGSNDITIVTRILALYPTNEYTRKDNSGKGRYRRINLFDANAVARLTLWDDNTELIEQLKITIGTPVRIVDGYVRQGLDGKPNLNLGKRGRIEVVTDEKSLAKLVPLEGVVSEIGDAINGQEVAAVRGVAVSDSRTSSFTRSDESKGTLTQLMVSDVRNAKQVRVVVWSGLNLPEVRAGQRVRITNLRVRQQANGDKELHGDNGSVILVEAASGPASTAKPAKPRELAIANVHVSASGIDAFAVDDRKAVYSLRITGEAMSHLQSFKQGSVVEVIPDEESNDGGTSTLVCRDKESITLAKPASRTLSLSDLFTKIAGIKGASTATPLILEVLALSKGSVQDVHMKDGTVTKKGELAIGDDTGETKLIGWKDEAEKLRGIEPGQRLRLLGVTLQVSSMGVGMLQLANFSKIEKIDAS